MNRHEKLWEWNSKNGWKQMVNFGSWIILGLLTLVSLFYFFNVCRLYIK